MSVKEVDSVVLLFPNEEWSNTATDAQLNAVVAQLRPNISYALNLKENLRTLSTHNADQSGTIGGFIYVPDLDADDPCLELAEQHIPSNVTRQANLPPTDFTLVALAPWINVECTLAFLDAADKDPVRGFLFYLPNDGSSQPPSSASLVWDLGDGGDWKSKHGFPVYALPSDIGQEMMHQSSLYSGNMTSVPYGHQISEISGVDPRDYVRIYTELRVSNGAIIGYPILLVIIIAVLLLMVGATSTAMHLISRSRRKSLQRRVANGEVNLEALGIKRLTVPREHVYKLPLFTYSKEEAKLPPVFQRSKKDSTSTTTSTIAEHKDTFEGSNAERRSEFQDTPLPLSLVIDESASNFNSTLLHRHLPYSQPTCPICLDDYESGTTPIRELPCGHIYHPDCIDSFLINNSSLCPMCKKSVMPKGYCPTKITNSMVRRERNIRRLRARVTINDEEDYTEPYTARNRLNQYQATMQRVLHRPATAPRNTSEFTFPMDPQTALTANELPPPNVSILGNIVPGHIGPSARREIAQRRIRELAARRSPDSDAVQRSQWRKALVQVFPGFL